jgi:hypothetical protein
MTQDAVVDGDLRQCLEVLQAIRVLQRWLLGRPLSADGLCLTATCLTLHTGSDVVASMTIPSPEPSATR